MEISTAGSIHSSARAATPSDAELLAAMAEKKEWALATLYDRYAATLYSLAKKILGDSGPAQDVVHEAFLTAWRKAVLYNQKRGNVATWLIVLCRNLAIDQYRAKMRLASRTVELETASEWLTTTENDPATAAIAAEDGRRIQEALRELPLEQKQVIEMAYFQGMSQSEIAAATQTPLGTVKTRTRQAMTKLRECLASARYGVEVG
jgi:RNA polymerase sigma-70 factor (ECF subfamily)